MREIIELREHFSAIELAEKLGITRMMVYAYQSGKHKPGMEVYKRIILLLELINKK